MTPERLDDPDLESLREAYRESLTDARDEGRLELCPEEEQLAAFVIGELGGEDRLRVADHLVACSSCSAAYRDLRDLHREAVRESAPGPALEGIPTVVKKPGRSLWPGLAVAAGVGFLVLASILLWQLRFAAVPDDDVLRSDGVSMVDVSPSADATLAAAPARFSWRPQIGAETYEVELSDDQGGSVWSSGPITASTVALPPRVATGLEAGRSYYWIVTFDGGATGDRLGPFWFQLER